MQLSLHGNENPGDQEGQSSEDEGPAWIEAEEWAEVRRSRIGHGQPLARRSDRVSAFPLSATHIRLGETPDQPAASLRRGNPTAPSGPSASGERHPSLSPGCHSVRRPSKRARFHRYPPALRLAMERYDKCITVSGSVEFKAAAIREAVDTQLPTLPSLIQPWKTGGRPKPRRPRPSAGQVCQQSARNHRRIAGTGCTRLASSMACTFPGEARWPMQVGAERNSKSWF